MKTTANNAYDWALAANKLSMADGQLALALLGRRLPSQTASLEQTETKIVEVEIEVEERRLALYHVLYRSKPGNLSHGKERGSSSGKIHQAPAVE
jgi:hypothetical protein